MKQYATLWIRLKAFFFDYLIIAIYLIIISVLFALLPVAQLFENRIQAQVIGFLLVTLPITLYFAFSESSIRQATWGKQKQSLKVVDEHENKISFSRAFLRNVLKFLPWEISHTFIWQIQFFPESNSALIGFGFVYLLIGLNIASMFITKTKQTLYDLIIKTFVVKI